MKHTYLRLRLEKSLITFSFEDGHKLKNSIGLLLSILDDIDSISIDIYSHKNLQEPCKVSVNNAVVESIEII